MTNQVDAELLLDEKDVVSWADTSEKSEESLELAPVPMTIERQLAIAYNVFAGYANRKQGNYPDMIMRDLRLAGVDISGREELLWICNSLIGYFLIQEKERYFTFSWQGAENENVQQRKLWVSKTVIFSVLALAAFASVSVVAVSLAHSRANASDVVTAKDLVLPTVSASVVPEVVSLVQKSVNNQSIYDSVDALINSGSFISALKIIRDPASLLDSAFSLQAKKWITHLVLVKSDSLDRIITGLTNEGKYHEAFELERQFDKELFQLAGNDFSRQLNQRLLKGWIFSYRGWCSKDSAITIVTAEIQEILSRSYLVKEGESGEFYLEYDPSKNRKKS